MPRQYRSKNAAFNERGPEIGLQLCHSGFAARDVWFNLSSMDSPHDVNRAAWDDRVRKGLAHTETAGDRQFADPWTFIDDCGWLGRNVAGKKVLCLAAGGGWHGPLFASVGADVTVVDLSPEMLSRDTKLAKQRGLQVRTVEASMDDLSTFADAAFDLVIQPVSTCYVADINRVYREVARVTAPGGLYISQHKQPVNLQSSATLSSRGYQIEESYYRTGALPAAGPNAIHREAGTLEYLHRWDDLLGGICRAGFVIEDVAEPRHGDPHAKAGSFRHRSWFVPPYITFKARRTHQSTSPTKLWIPGA
jgi:SAM-dependent methyltransferase